MSEINNKKPNIIIVDYGFGNLFSLAKALEYLGARPLISDKPSSIKGEQGLILPGVGAFGDGIKGLKKGGFSEPIIAHTKTNKPLLGICLGMQFLFDYSEEFGHYKGLGLIKGKVAKIPESKRNEYKIPHIGWNSLFKPKSMKNWQKTILFKIKEGNEVYFIHSYAGYQKDKKDILANTEYGGHILTAAVMNNNIIGTQFHPEKSGQIGLKILKNFINLTKKYV